MHEGPSVVNCRQVDTIRTQRCQTGKLGGGLQACGGQSVANGRPAGSVESFRATYKIGGLSTIVVEL